MREFVCTWWENTGRNAPFDKSGISKRIYRNLDTGEEATELPPGALYATPRRSNPSHTPDGLSVVCIVPYERDKCSNKTVEWYIDGRANNCDRPNEEHLCWVRHGTVGEKLHVDKNGRTCGAGAGSIMVPGFHGFLHNGVLREC